MLTKTLTALCATATLTFSVTAYAKPQVKTLELGAKAPDFSLEGTDGKTYSLNSFKDAKILVAVFTCNHCPDAIAARDKINQFAIDYKSKGVEVVAISSASPEGVQVWENNFSKYDDDFESMKLVAKEHKLVHPYLYDGEAPQATSVAYGAVATPHVFIFDEDRKLRYQGQFDNGKRKHGPAEKTPAIDAVNAILEGKEVPVKTSRVFGCSTKWYWKKDLVARELAEWDAAPVTLEVLDAKTAKTIAENKTNRYRLVNIWSTTCGPCVREFPSLVAAYKIYHRRPFDLITVSTDEKEDFDKVHTFLKEQELATSKWTKRGLDAEGRKSNNYHFQGDLEDLANSLDPKWQGPMPYTLLIGPGGEVIWRHTGEVTLQELRNQIVDAMDTFSIAAQMKAKKAAEAKKAQ